MTSKLLQNTFKQFLNIELGSLGHVKNFLILGYFTRSVRRDMVYFATDSTFLTVHTAGQLFDMDDHILKEILA